MSFHDFFQPACNNYWYNNCHRQRGPAMGKHMHSFIFAPYCVFRKNNRKKDKDKGKEMKNNQALFAHTA